MKSVSKDMYEGRINELVVAWAQRLKEEGGNELLVQRFTLFLEEVRKSYQTVLRGSQPSNKRHEDKYWKGVPSDNDSLRIAIWGVLFDMLQNEEDTSRYWWYYKVIKSSLNYELYRAGVPISELAS